MSCTPAFGVGPRAGTYLVGTDGRRDYTGGIVLSRAFALVLDDAAVVQMKPTPTPFDF